MQLAQNLHRDSALAGNYVGVVKGVNKGKPLLGLQLNGVGIGITIAFTSQHNFAAQRFYRVNFELRRGRGHHNDCPRAQLAPA